MINKVILIGRLTKEPEVRKTNTGKSVCQFSVAVNRNFKNANGQYDADFINCVAWNQTADYMSNYLHKGYQVSVEGRLTSRNYDDPNTPGRKVFVTEVTAEAVNNLESRASAESRQNGSYNNSYNTNNNNTYYGQEDNYSDMSESSPAFNISRDDLPF